ncbi:hypothetical protein ACFWUW_32130 [Streptomyces sp. NPDC058655]|uniref:hypothetical protein n=1 Tax=Streptomyces sp. NPDC058655 TaxID=3346577 RepID=UPI00366002CF
MRRTDFDHIVRLGWLSPVGTAAVDYGRAYGGVVQVPLYSAAAVALLPQTRPHVDWRQVHRTAPGRRSPLAALQPAAPWVEPADADALTGAAGTAWGLVEVLGMVAYPPRTPPRTRRQDHRNRPRASRPGRLLPVDGPDL